jgi:hypothetical protein
MKHKGLRARKGSRPITVNGKVPPRRLANASRRPREYLTPEEVKLLIETARRRIGARNPHRDATMILVAYRHGLRASGICCVERRPAVASVNVVEFRSGSEVATGQAARGGSPRVSASGSGEASPAIASICM